MIKKGDLFSNKMRKQGSAESGFLYYPPKEFAKNAWMNKPAVYKEAARNPIKYWEGLAKELYWQKKWKKAFVHTPPYFKWFVGGKINITENALDSNLKERKNKVAVIWESESPEETPKKLTYQDLYNEVNKLANALKNLGVKKGDRVGIYLPMIPEVIISMLACTRIGAVHAVVFSAFSPTALQTRLIDSEAKILITSDGYYRGGKVINLKVNADAAVADTKVEKMVVVKRAGNEVFWQEGRDLWWQDLVKNESTECKAVAIDAEDPLFILYTSGSTGKPKGCVHTTGGYIVQAKNTTKWIFDLHDNDIFWSTADIGWITGHTYSCYGPLLCGATFIIFEGLIVYPSPDRWCDIIEKYGVTVYYTAPTAIRMFGTYDKKIFEKRKMQTLRLLGSVGEPIDEAAWLWYFKYAGKERCPIIDTWWQTETGGILITSLPGIGPFKPSFTGLPLPPIKIDILNDKGKSCKAGESGNLVILPPFAPGLLRGIYKNPQKYIETYWSQYNNKIYFTSDGAYRDKKGLVRIVGRVDDVIKVAGHRVATGELENAINSHPEINESAVVGIPDAIKGEVPLAFAVYKGQRSQDEIKKEIIDAIKKEIGPIALPKEVYLVDALPTTRSGKIMRRILKKLFTGEELGDLSTLSNPESVDKIKSIIKPKNV